METLSEPRMGRLDGPVVDYQFSDVICLAYDRSSPEQSHPAANMVVDLVFANAGVLIKVRVVETQHFLEHDLCVAGFSFTAGRG